MCDLVMNSDNMEEVRMKSSFLQSVLLDDSHLSWYFACFLPAGSIFGLHRTCRRTRHRCEQWRSKLILSQRIQNRLIDKSCNLKLIKEFLKQDSVLTGSFVLRSIQGGDWESNDIDIFSKKSYKRAEECVREFNNMCFDVILNRDYDDVLSILEIDDPDKVHTKKLKIQFIILENPADLYVNLDDEYVLQKLKEYNEPTERFDLDFLKNTYDGKRLVVRHCQSLIEQNSIFVESQIPKKHSSGGANLNLLFSQRFTHDTSSMRNIDRIEKYLSRGYSIPNLKVEHISIHGLSIDYFYINDKKFMPVIRGLDRRVPYQNESLYGYLNAFCSQNREMSAEGIMQLMDMLGPLLGEINHETRYAFMKGMKLI